MTERSLKVDLAKRIIARAERDLGKLTVGQRRDLLMDQTQWTSDEVKSIVSELGETV